jgi:hypothetical protein
MQHDADPYDAFPPPRRSAKPVDRRNHNQLTAGTVYVVRAIHVDGVTGTFTAKTNSQCEALELAKSLRENGLWVIITGPDGETVDQSEK